MKTTEEILHDNFKRDLKNLLEQYDAKVEIYGNGYGGRLSYCFNENESRFYSEILIKSDLNGNMYEQN